MSQSSKNSFQKWLSESVGDMPETEIGTYTEPFYIGDLHLPTGEITVCDRWVLWPDEGVSIQAQPGIYRLYSIGVEFEDGHRRVSSLLLVLQDTDISALRYELVDEIPVDSWGVVLGEYKQWFDSHSEDDIEATQVILAYTYVDGCELFELESPISTVSLAQSFTGLGSGGYPVETAWESDRIVGVRCSFIFGEDVVSPGQ